MAGEGRDIPLAFQYTEMEGVTCQSRSPNLPSPPFCFPSGLAEASSRIIVLLLSAPPLGGSIVAMVGPP